MYSICDVQQEIKKAEMRDAGIPAVISYEEDNTTFVWKHPMTDFVTGSQLIVHENQEAIFFCNGEALDSFAPGLYTLDRYPAESESNVPHAGTGAALPR